MDYTREPLLFRLRKVARYTQLYGVRRTRIKVLGQLHMKRRFDVLPPVSTELRPNQDVALIGCGNYAFANIAYYLTRQFGRVLGACMDRNLHRAASLARHYHVPFYTDDAATLLADPRIRLVYIASNHASHADYAIQALAAGKHVYIEKPHVVNEAQLHGLVAALGQYRGRVFLGFNRPVSRFGRLILEYLRAEPGPGMYSLFIAGHRIDPDHWYCRPEEGGRVLGNLCHWTDFVLHMAAPHAFPVRIRATRGTKRDTDMVVTYTFPDESIAVISFSEGHAFEGVKEHLDANRGNCLISMSDYRTLQVEVVERKRRYFNLHRDHGHRANIVRAYEAARGGAPYDRDAAIRHLANTAWLFLKTREALELESELTIEEYRGAPTTARASQQPAGSR